MSPLLICFLLYIVGFVLTLSSFIIFGNYLTGVNFDKSKKYYDDWNSNANAFVAWSFGWFLFLPIALIIWLYKSLVKLVDNLIKMKNK